MSKRKFLKLSIKASKRRENVMENQIKEQKTYPVEARHNFENTNRPFNATFSDREETGPKPFWSKNLRIALYSPDTMGLGHMRRCRKIAQALVASPLQLAVLMINGGQESRVFSLPPGVDSITLPALHKGLNGEYSSRSLGVSLDELISLRARTIHAALEAFEPDVLIVDKAPRGFGTELDSILEYLHTHCSTLFVLGLRDILDDPNVVRKEWHYATNEDVISRYYHGVWIYGDPTVYDLAHECQFSDNLLAKITYTGYLGQRESVYSTPHNGEHILNDLSLPPGRLACCLVGGGQDGAHLAEAFAQADLSEDMNGVILMGPFMPADVQSRLRKYAEINERLRVIGFLSEPSQLLNRADAVVCMGGYNTLCEVLSHDKRALVVPRVKPRVEQLIRAERLQDLGLVDMIHPDRLCGRSITEWLASGESTIPKIRNSVDVNGLSRLPSLIESLVRSGSKPIIKNSIAGRN